MNEKLAREYLGVLAFCRSSYAFSRERKEPPLTEADVRRWYDDDNAWVGQRWRACKVDGKTDVKQILRDVMQRGLEILDGKVGPP